METDELQRGDRRWDSVQSILGPPALLADESEVEYSALLDRILDSVRPKDAVEECYALDAVNYLWELRRCRRAAARLIDSSHASGLWRMLNYLVPGSQNRLDLISRWARGEPQARQEVADLLENGGLEEAHISAHTMAALAKPLDILHRQIFAASHRWEDVLRAIEGRRQTGLAHRLRAGVEMVQDAEIIETQRRLPSDGAAAA